MSYLSADDTTTTTSSAKMTLNFKHINATEENESFLPLFKKIYLIYNSKKIIYRIRNL